MKLLPAIPNFPNISGLCGWWDASDLTSITLSAGTFTWVDKSGVGIDATQIVASRIPTSGLRTKNGRNVLSFDGGDVLRLNTSTVINALASSDMTAFVVSQDLSGTQTSGTSVWRLALSGSTRVNLSYSSTSGNMVFEYYNGSGTTSATVTGIDKTNWLSLACYRQGTNFGISVNNGVFVKASGATNSSSNNAALGAGSTTPILPFNGDIAEFIFYNRALNNTEISIVQTYLKTKWGL